MPHPWIALTLVWILLTAPASASGLAFEILADERVRQESLDGVYHFAPTSDRNWIRVRTRLGLRVEWQDHMGEARLGNEHRHLIEPDQDLDWDEVFIDRLLWTWRPREGLDLTAGRQDILWPGGFLVLEGHPLDGSRSIFHDAVRLQTDWGGSRLDVAVVHNEKQDPAVLVDDQERNLTFADETGVLARLSRGAWSWSLIMKDESDPDSDLDLQTWTAGSRFRDEVGETSTLEAELALQYQDGPVAVALAPFRDSGAGWAFAGHASLSRAVGGRVTATAGAYYYSGLDGAQRPFHAPWGQWPKWSELYIYTLLGESTPGRPHVAAWENVAAPRLTLQRPVTGWLDARLGVDWLLAPEPDWSSRGVLARAKLEASGKRTGLTGHLLFERLDPGAFHDGRHGLPPLTGAVHFLRWQLSWSL